MCVCVRASACLRACVRACFVPLCVCVFVCESVVRVRVFFCIQPIIFHQAHSGSFSVLLQMDLHPHSEGEFPSLGQAPFNTSHLCRWKQQTAFPQPHITPPPEFPFEAGQLSHTNRTYTTQVPQNKISINKQKISFSLSVAFYNCFHIYSRSFFLLFFLL